MAFVVDLARRNVEHGTGGPFAAGVFERDTGGLIAIGVNMVEPSQTAVAHAEMVAITLAGRAVGSFDLSVRGATELVASTEPCAMCLGAVPWSGVRRLVCGATDADAREVGFDEGDSEVGRATVNQRVGGSGWSPLGTWDFGASGWNSVLLSRWTASGSVVVADAVRLTPSACP